MGIRANALTDYRVPDFRDRDAVLALLAPTLAAVRTVANYWQAASPSEKDTVGNWTVEFIQNPQGGDYLRYHGPGGFSLAFGERVAAIHAACRWSGFCTIAQLQQIHVAAFYRICLAIGGSRMVLIPDFDPVDDIGLYGGGSLETCVTLLEQRWGAPHPKTGIITEDVEVLYRRKSPAWFLEKLA